MQPVNLINGSPRVEGTNVLLDVRTDHPLQCAIRLAGMTSELEDCECMHIPLYTLNKFRTVGSSYIPQCIYCMSYMMKTSTVNLKLGGIEL